jgi:hypothetical protein
MSNAQKTVIVEEAAADKDQLIEVAMAYWFGDGSGRRVMLGNEVLSDKGEGAQHRAAQAEANEKNADKVTFDHERFCDMTTSFAVDIKHVDSELKMLILRREANKKKIALQSNPSRSTRSLEVTLTASFSCICFNAELVYSV